MISFYSGSFPYLKIISDRSMADSSELAAHLSQHIRNHVMPSSALLLLSLNALDAGLLKIQQFPPKTLVEL